MFVLGIMVGRGTAPVEFDTKKFQKRLAAIANESGEKKRVQKKINLKFYDALDKPVPEEHEPSENNSLEIMPKKEIAVTSAENVEHKIKRKLATLKKKADKVKTDNKADKTVKKEKGRYTIQIAAHKNFKDAVSHMALLEKKGFSSYRVKGQKEGTTWYRIRTGPFATFAEAEKFQEKLEKAKIKSIILKKGQS